MSPGRHDFSSWFKEVEFRLNQLSVNRKEKVRTGWLEFSVSDKEWSQLEDLVLEAIETCCYDSDGNFNRSIQIAFSLVVGTAAATTRELENSSIERIVMAVKQGASNFAEVRELVRYYFFSAEDH